MKFPGKSKWKRGYPLPPIPRRKNWELSKKIVLNHEKIIIVTLICGVVSGIIVSFFTINFLRVKFGHNEDLLNEDNALKEILFFARSDRMKKLIRPMLPPAVREEFDGDWLVWELSSFQVVDFEKGYCVARYYVPMGGNGVTSYRDIEFILKNGRFEIMNASGSMCYEVTQDTVHEGPKECSYHLRFPFYYSDINSDSIRKLMFKGLFKKTKLIGITEITEGVVGKEGQGEVYEIPLIETKE